MNSKRLVVIDGYSLLYRSFFATRFLSTSAGHPTNAIFGFVSMLFILMEKVKPNAIVVALDAPGGTFRHEEYEAYKGTRKETADELKIQLKDFREFIVALGIPSIEVKGFEADDVVGTISKKAEENGYDTTIVTGDLDSLQLVDDCISVLTMKIGVTDTITYDPAGVVARFGFEPKFLPDYKAFKGDTSDNIPGVPGIGDKGAAELIGKFGTIENLLAHFDEVDPKYQKKIAGNEKQMLQSKHLATIVCDVPLEYDFQPFQLDENQMAAAIAMMEAFEFRQHARRAPGIFAPYLKGSALAEADPFAEPHDPFAEDERIVARVDNIPDYDSLAGWVGERPFAAFFSAPQARKDLFDDEVEPLAFVAIETEVREVKESDALRLVGEHPSQAVLHDSKQIYKRLMPSLNPPRFDTMLAAYILRSERSNYPLRDLVQAYLDFAPPETPHEMAAALYLLEAPLRERLVKEGQDRVYFEVELLLVPILADMENLGIAASREGLREFSQSLEQEIASTQSAVHELCGEEFNIGSPKQLGFILFEKMQIPGGQKTKTGWATGAEVLGELAASFDVCREVLRYRELTKLKSTYADALQSLIRADGRIHTTYVQTVAATGRLSSNDPNLQNVPIRTELGRGIRKAFHAPEGYFLASLDYSQIELRILAHMCEEPALVRAFKEREDVHTVTAEQIFQLGEIPPTKEQRRLAKMLNYAVLYGVTEFGLAQQLGVGFGYEQARELIKAYNERFPTVKAFTDSIIQEAKSKGFTTTLYGRRRYFPDIHAPKIMDRKAAERQAINAPLQGTAADMMKLAMIRAQEIADDCSARMLLTVHDELLFEIPLGEESLVEPLRTAMETALPLSVPVEVDAKLGPNWDEMKVVERP
jgi:DNA polymerase-1